MDKSSLQMNRIAVFDLGTNTFHMLIASCENEKLQVVKKVNKGVRLGAGGITQGTISIEAYQRALDGVAYLKQVGQEYGLWQMPRLAYGTSMFRNASNGAMLAKDIEGILHTHVQIISGEQEAELIHAGILASGAYTSENALSVDIGGGSVEFIIANKAELFWRKSLEIGGQRLMDKFHLNDPITQKEVEALRQYLTIQMQEVWEKVTEYNVKILIGASGSFDTLAQMQEAVLQNKVLDVEQHRNYTLNKPLLVKQLLELQNKNREERLAIPGMIPLRVDMIVVASILIQTLIEHIQPKEVLTSTFALKEGAAYRFFKS
jgi:exopolyphosphatase/guanosine-5'-triphosphate,3'-diphosphate pyrophosphatase